MKDEPRFIIYQRWPLALGVIIVVLIFLAALLPLLLSRKSFLILNP